MGGGRYSMAQAAARTGLSEASLRAWETRYGVPRPERTAGGQRRYSEGDIALVRRVLEERAAGVSLPQAIRLAAEPPAAGRAGIFPTVLGRHAELGRLRLPRQALLCLSRALEDECSLHAQGGVLVGGFQRESAYRRVEPRWRELAAGMALAVAFAAFPRAREPAGAPAEIPLSPGEPIRREWMIACLAPSYAACLLAWEPLGSGESGSPRHFEVVWSADPTVVRSVMELVGAALDERSPVHAARLRGLLEATRPPEMEPATVARLVNRMLAYLVQGLLPGAVPAV